MKKLLLVLMVVALASFLFVGCVPTTTPAEGEGEGETEVGICPTVSVTSQVAVGTKTFIKGGKQTITVTFAVPTEPVAVYVGQDLTKAAPSAADEVVVYANADKTVYTGTVDFSTTSCYDCNEAYIYVDTCLECDYCKYPYTVDTALPYAKIHVTAADCTCEGVALTFKSISSTLCAETSECCGDDCSGLASWAIDLYKVNPFDVCCNTPCVTPIYSCSGVGCPVDCVTDCLPTSVDSGYVSTGYYVVTTLLDEVGNQARYYTRLEKFDADFLTAVKADTGNDYEVVLMEYSQDKAEEVAEGVLGICSWFCRPINTDYDTGEYGFCSDSSHNVVAAQAICGVDITNNLPD